jgi:hypothetical protein
MGQLTSPPFSAREFCTWVIDELDDPNKPLATVALLVSEKTASTFRNPKTGQDHQLQHATFDNVSRALHAWNARAANDDDRLIFFFCGHGLARGFDTALLCDDYGSPNTNPLDAAIDFETLHLAMDKCIAREQIYFVDACRSTGDILVRLGGASVGRSVFAPDVEFIRPGGPREAPVYYSTLAGQGAYSIPGKVSRFTEALLIALKGLGADNSEGGIWRITTLRLKEAIDWLMRKVVRAGERSAPQVPPTSNLTTFSLHYPPRTPEVPVFVECSPSEANDVATFRCTTGTGVVQERRPSPGEWELQLPAGDYEFDASFSGSTYRSAKAQANVRPVYVRVRKLEVGP